MNISKDIQILLSILLKPLKPYYRNQIDPEFKLLIPNQYLSHD